MMSNSEARKRVAENEPSRVEDVLARAVRDSVRIHAQGLGPNAQDVIRNGGAVHLTPAEAEEVAAHIAAALAAAGIGDTAEAQSEAAGWREQAMKADASTPEALRLARIEGAQAVLDAVEQVAGGWPHDYKNAARRAAREAARNAGAS